MAVIRDPGKFEGEQEYVRHYWNQVMDGLDDETFELIDGTLVSVFYPTPTDCGRFPELGTAYAVVVAESDQGFVYGKVFTSCDEYDTWTAKVTND